MFDYEQQREYSLVLQVEDNSPASPRASEPSTVTIRIQNLDDEPTVFSQPEYSEYLASINNDIDSTIVPAHTLHDLKLS